MRIAMIGQKGLPARYGGIERHVEQLSLRLGQAGHEVLVYSRAWFGSAAGEYAPGVRTVITPTIHTKHLDAITHTFVSTFYALRSGVDVIHYHGVGPSLLAWIPRLLAPRVRVISTFHCIDARQRKWGRLAKFALRMGERCACWFPHRTVTVARWLQEYCRDSYQRACDYVPNGVESVERSNSDNDTKTLAEFGLEPNGYVLMVARLLPDKGAHHLVRAYQELRRQNKTRGKKLVIVGGSAFTMDYVDQLLQLVEGESDIVLTGYQHGSVLEALFANAYLVAHPSETEGLPITILEAMSYGRAVLASNIPENLEVTRGQAINFNNRDVADLTAKLDFMLAAPDLVARLGEQSQQYVLQNYNWDDVAVGVADVYHRAAASEKSASVEHLPA